jgi:hypothetical protein
MADAEGAAATPRGAAAFDRVAQAVHWFAVVLVVCVVVLGWTIEGAPRNSSKRDFLMLVREPVGLTIFAAMVFRGVGVIPRRRCHPFGLFSKLVSPGSPIWLSICSSL